MPIYENAAMPPVPLGEVLPITLRESRVDQDRKEQRMKSPNGRFHCFADGQRFAMIKEDSERKPYVLKKEGVEAPFEAWLASKPEYKLTGQTEEGARTAEPSI